MSMESCVALWFWCCSFLFLAHSSLSQCIPQSGSIHVSDSCAIALMSAINGSVFKETGFLQVTDPALYSTVGNITAADLLQLRLPVRTVVGPAVPYGGGGAPTQDITVVDALTADAKFGASGSLLTLDITQLLAQALFAKAADGIYPNLQDPFLARELEMDNVVGLLTDISFSVGGSYSQSLITNALLSDIKSLLTVEVPLTSYVASATPQTTSTVGLASMLFDALYLPSVNNLAGSNTAYFNEFIGINRLLGIPYMDGYTPMAAASCTHAASNSAPSFPNGNAYGPAVWFDKTINYWTSFVLSPVSNIPLETVSRCYGQSITVPDADFRLVQPGTITSIMAINNFPVT